MGAADRIAETILRQGQIQAEGLNRSAEIQARAQQNNAQIWSGALQSLGQLPGEIAKYKLADTENKLRTQELDQRQRMIQGEKDANWIYQGLMKPGPDGTVNIDESTLPKMQAGMANAGVPLEIQERAINSLKGINQSNQQFRQQQLEHQVRVAQNVMSSVTPDHPLTPGTALATIKMMQANGAATAEDVNKFMAAMNQGHDPADLFNAVIKYGTQPQKQEFGELPAGATIYNKGTGQLGPTAPAKAEAPKPPNTPFEAALAAVHPKDPLHPTEDEVTRAQALAAKSTEAGSEPLVEVRTMVNGKPVTQFLPRSQAAGQTFPSQPPASIIYPKPEAGQQSEIQVKPDTQMYRVAQDIAYGKLTMADFNRIYGRAMGNAGTKVAIYDKARELNPDFDPSKFELGFKLAGNPAIRQRLVAIDSLGPVIDKIEGLAQQADLTNVPALNKLLSAGKFAVGDKTITNYRQLQTLLGDEVGNALGVGSGSDLKTKLGLDLVNPNLGPQQFIASMEQIRSVLGARKDTLLKQFGPYAGAAGGNTPQPTQPPAAAPSSLDALKAKRKALGLE